MSDFSKKSRSLGFTLTELMIGVAILAIVMSVAIPDFQIWMKNSQIRTAAESIQNGLQRARAEAVARNGNVEFAFVGADTSWRVTVVGGADIETRSGNEGSKLVTKETSPGGATAITFNNFGGVVANAGNLTSIKIDSSVLTAAESNELRVTIGTGGNARMCDPNAPPSSSRGC